MSTEQERHAHFQGFAKLLFERLKPDLALLLIEVNRNKPDAIEKAEHIIQGVMAEALYDFTRHIVDETSVAGYEGLHSVEEIIHDIPDMTAWPEQEEN